MTDIVEATESSVEPTEATLDSNTALTSNTEPTEAPEATADVVTVDSYKLEREGLDFDAWKVDNSEFLSKAAEHGITNEQLDFLVSEYDTRAVELLGGASQLNTEDTVSSLQEEWGKDYDSNINSAYKAATAAGITPDQMNDPNIGNNIAFIKLASHYGKQLGEANPVRNVSPAQGEDIGSLMRSEAYSNPKHPEHKAVSAKVNNAYSQGFTL